MDRFIGKRLDGRYEIHELIGVGGMAYVYKAYDRVEGALGGHQDFEGRIFQQQRFPAPFPQ